MKDWIKSLSLILALAICPMRSAALSLSNDTLFVFETWQQMLDNTPAMMMVNPVMDVVNPHEVYIVTGSDAMDKMFINTNFALLLGDDWLISSTYLKKHFKGDVKHLKGFVPVFFNDKAAYVTQLGNIKLKDYLIGSDVDFEYTSNSVTYYNIDFEKRLVQKVTPSSLPELLRPYHDLLMRYEGLRDRKKQHVIKEFYFEYIDRVTQDDSRPAIIELVK